MFCIVWKSKHPLCDEYRFLFYRVVAKLLELQSEKRGKTLLTQQVVPWLMDSLSYFSVDEVTYNILKCLMFATSINSIFNPLQNNIDVDKAQV
jgi:hypothetical protein